MPSNYQVKDQGHYQNKAAYTILALNLEGKKEVLGLYLFESEGANLWLGVMTELQNRGVEDILIASVDGLTGFPEVIHTIYPQTDIQICVGHQIRDSLRYVATKHRKEFLVDLKRVYRGLNKNAAEAALDEPEQVWGNKYPIVIKSWRTKWDNLSTDFRYPEPIRKVIYTSNSLEAVHRQIRKLMKTKGGFPNDNSVLKLLYMGIQNASNKWTMPIQNWNLTLSQPAIFFEGWIDGALARLVEQRKCHRPRCGRRFHRPVEVAPYMKMSTKYTLTGALSSHREHSQHCRGSTRSGQPSE